MVFFVLCHYSTLKQNGIMLGTLSFHADIRVKFVLPSYTFGEAYGTGFIEVEKTGVVQEPFSVIVQGGTFI